MEESGPSRLPKTEKSPSPTKAFGLGRHGRSRFFRQSFPIAEMYIFLYNRIVYSEYPSVAAKFYRFGNNKAA